MRLLVPAASYYTRVVMYGFTRPAINSLLLTIRLTIPVVSAHLALTGFIHINALYKLLNQYKLSHLCKLFTDTQIVLHKRVGNVFQFIYYVSLSVVCFRLLYLAPIQTIDCHNVRSLLCHEFSQSAFSVLHPKQFFVVSRTISYTNVSQRLFSGTYCKFMPLSICQSIPTHRFAVVYHLRHKAIIFGYSGTCAGRSLPVPNELGIYPQFIVCCTTAFVVPFMFRGVAGNEPDFNSLLHLLSCYLLNLASSFDCFRCNSFASLSRIPTS